MLTRDGALRVAARRTALALWVVVPVASVAVVGALIPWTWSTELGVRRFAATLSVAVLLACVAGLLTARGASERAGAAEAYAAVRPDGLAPGSGLPGSVPSGRAVAARGMAGAVVFLTALAGIWGLAAGDGRNAERAEGIRQAGARVVNAPVTQVQEAESDSAGAMVTVLLHSDGGPVTSTFTAGPDDDPQEGGHMPVMYAPEHPQLGSVHGDPAKLEQLMSGRAMTPGFTWGLGITWLVLCVAALSAGAGRLRAVTDIRVTRALRVSCTGAGGDRVLLLRADDGAEVPFRFRGRAAAALADTVGEEDVWLCWKPPRGRRRTVAAVLVGDSGWVLHGDLTAQTATGLQPVAVDPSQDGRIDEERTVKLWHPSSAWPLVLPSGALLGVVFALACAAVLVTALGVTWRWQLGFLGSLALAAAPLAWLWSTRTRTQPEPAPEALREPVKVT